MALIPMASVRFTFPAMLATVLAVGCTTGAPEMKRFEDYTLDYDTATDRALQEAVEGLDAALRKKYRMTPDHTAVGVLDLRRLRLAMIHPDRIEYGASVPKIGILLAYFALHPAAATNVDTQTRHELGLMIKISSNEMATKYSQELGLKRIQQALETHGFYDAKHGGGLWIGKHYGQSSERYGDPVGGHSHAVTVRQLLRFYLALEQRKLVSPSASQTMREIFASPEIPHLNDKFVKGLASRDVQVLRKSGWWEDWFHDTAIVSGGERHYILVALTHHSKGEEYLVDLASGVDDVLLGRSAARAER
jgi:beta-lactamase class A